MKKNYILTFITEFIVLSCQILVFKLAASFLGNQGFGEYALAKRGIAFLQTAIFLGMGIAIPRFIAMSLANSSHNENPDSYFLSGFSIIAITAVVLLTAMNLMANQVAFVFFGKELYSHLILPVTVAIVGMCLHSLSYCYYRGHLKMLNANLLQLLNLGIIPLTVFIIPAISVSKIFWVVGLAWIITSGIALFSVVKNIQITNLSFHQLRDKSKVLLGYGLLRVPGDFGIAAMLTLPAFLTAHFAGIEKAGYVAFGVSVLGLIGSLFRPIGLVLLPKATKLVAEKDFSSLKSHLFKILKISLGITVTIILFSEIFTHQIIKIYLGKGFTEAANIVRAILLGSIPYVVYIVFKDASDAIYFKPMNVKNILIALIFFLSICFYGGSLAKLLIGFCGGFFLLGILTWYDVVKTLKRTNYEDKTKNL